ncbi:MAG: hypothetical protein M3463_09050 [Verrucomicrobiota bacterium]|nr:hypothetical protein [Verrucomicrobiota bacterium]
MPKELRQSIPEEGMRWARELPRARARSAAITGVMSSYAHKSPTKIGALINELPGWAGTATRRCADMPASLPAKAIRKLELAAQIRGAEVREQTFLDRAELVLPRRSRGPRVARANPAPFRRDKGEPPAREA